jgi:hypothetical protein
VLCCVVLRCVVFSLCCVVLCCVALCCVFIVLCLCRSRWPRGLRRRSAAARLLRSWVRIPPGT